MHEESENESLPALLTKLGLVSERDMAESVAELLQLPLLGAKDFPETPPASVQLSVRFLKQHHIVPVSESESGSESGPNLVSCPRCGAQYLATATTCVDCGARLRAGGA